MWRLQECKQAPEAGNDDDRSNYQRNLEHGVIIEVIIRHCCIPYFQIFFVFCGQAPAPYMLFRTHSAHDRLLDINSIAVFTRNEI